jgi:hypothetical protein
MPDRLAYQFLCLLLVFAAAVSAAAATHAPAEPEDAEEEEETAQPAEPEPPKQVVHVEVKDHLLTIEIENTDFGTVIRTIAEKANFKVQGSSAVFGKKLNTKFSDIEIERGVSRLLTLVKESNYLISYDTKGNISSLEIFASAPGSPAAPGIRPLTGVQPIVRPQTPALVQTPRPANIQPVPVRRPVPVPARPAAPAPTPARPRVIPSDEEEQMNEEIEEIPYVPSQTTPRFTPRR